MRLRIVQPCHEDWEAMAREGTGRRCEACRHAVHDLTAMTEREASRLLRARAGERTCVRVRVGPDGHAIFRAEPPRVLPAAAALALAACTPHSPEPGRLAAEVEAVSEDRFPAAVMIPQAPEQVTLAPQPKGRKPKPKGKPEPEVEARQEYLGFISDYD
jgi:hypothetical protein